MPLEKSPLIDRPPKPAKERTPTASCMKTERPGSEGHVRQTEKMAGGSDNSRKAQRPQKPTSESEKDSGFSDTSSEYLSAVEQTDTEDQSTYTFRRWSAKLQRLPWKARGSLAGSPFTGLNPVYIVKNVVLKQPLGASSNPQILAWSSQHALDNKPGQARLVLIQQPVTPLKPLLPSRKAQTKDTYLPILNAYPKIAPHPGRSRDSKGAGGAALGGSTGTARSKNKRFCLEETWVSSSEPAAPQGSRDEELKTPVSSSVQPAPSSECSAPSTGISEVLSQNTVTSSTGAPRLDPAEGRMLSRASKKLGASSLGKQRRFHNTVEILKKSGLLGITLKTKELIRQNNRTQRELAELREHARLLCEAVQNNDAEAWVRLQEAMNHSAAYWAKKGAGSGTPSQGLGAKAAAPFTDLNGESPPGSPMTLSPTPDTSVHTPLP
uniref:CLOCK-interacting pacemaker n=1 Tax=Sphenodon punctatus TaxID=8508 RepID=A0A8D0H3L4_SPHPU